MHGSETRSYPLIIAVTAILVVLGGLAVFAASKSVDLDGKTTNGAESTVALNVLSTFPTKIENKITNKAVSDVFTFVWPSAGLGGFAGTLGAGTATGVGTTWTWTTSQTVYLYTGNTCGNDICFTKTAGPDPVTARGPFSVPGRSAISSGVTLSSSALTSSLITFFSPPKTIFSITSSVGQTGSNLGYTTKVNNTAPTTLTLDVPAFPPGCCNDVHQLNCDGTCVYYLTDPLNCGACGNVCGGGTHCSEGVCVATCPAGTTLCGDTCVDLLNDPNNCGGCGNVCGDNQICTSGACVTCTSPNQTACDNECVNIHTDAENCGGCGVNCNTLCPSSGQGACSQGNSCHCLPGNGPRIPGPVTLAVEAPLCESQELQQTVPSGGTYQACQNSGVLAKEVSNTISICDGGNPPVGGLCDNGLPPTVGTYRQLLPDFTKAIPPVFPTPVGIYLIDASGDGLGQPGEALKVKVGLTNAGLQAVTGISAVLSSPAVDLTDDGVSNPVGITITGGTQPFPNIPGAPGSGGDCSQTSAPVVTTNNTPFTVTLPVNHPGDVSRPFNLHINGNSPGGPVSLDVPLVLGIGSKCDPAANQGDFDGLDGLSSPMAKLVPAGDPAFYAKAFSQGSSKPMKMRILCGTTALNSSKLDPPAIIALSEATLGAIDITKVNLNDNSNPFDPTFSYSASGQNWNYSLRTRDLAKGTYLITIRIDSRDFWTGFILN